MHTLYAYAMTPRNWFAGLFAEAHRIGLPLFASVFGMESLDLMESLDCPAYKVARLDNGHQQLLDACAATGKPVIVSASATDHVRGDITLFCPPGYPQSLDAFDGMSYGWSFDGMSYHGTDWKAGVAAEALGSSMVEAHFQLATEPSALEANVSLDEHQFAMMTGVR
jgi:sialic acid synthase SpsE